MPVWQNACTLQGACRPSSSCKMLIASFAIDTAATCLQVHKMHDAEAVSLPEHRVAKRRRTSPDIAAAKKRPAISTSRWCAL